MSQPRKTRSTQVERAMQKAEQAREQAETATREGLDHHNRARLLDKFVRGLEREQGQRRQR